MAARRRRRRHGRQEEVGEEHEGQRDEGAVEDVPEDRLALVKLRRERGRLRLQSPLLPGAGHLWFSWKSVISQSRAYHGRTSSLHDQAEDIGATAGGAALWSAVGTVRNRHVRQTCQARPR